MPAYESTEKYLNSTPTGRQVIRIRENVSAALTAIGAKGVTIPPGSNSDDLADLIAQISGGGNGYTLTTVAPQQTVTPTAADTGYRVNLSHSINLEEGADYIVTFDGVEYWSTCILMWGADYILGDINYLWSDGDQPYPFLVLGEGNTLLLATNTNATRTIKVEKIELTGSGGGGSSATLITKAITANGTYSAEDDDADGYSEVTVNVPQPSGSINITENGTHDVANYASAVVNVSSGASNVISGTFTGTTTNAAMNITLPYRGNGYPVAIVVYPTEGPYNSASGSFYNKIQRYGCAYFSGIKARANSAPTYDGSAVDTIATYSRYKNSSSSATSYSGSAANNTSGFSSSDAQNTVGHIVHFKPNNVLSVFIASNSYGFIAGIEYTYHIIYSE